MIFSKRFILARFVVEQELILGMLGVRWEYTLTITVYPNETYKDLIRMSTHAATEAQDRTRNPGAVRKQHYPLLHCTAQEVT